MDEQPLRVAATTLLQSWMESTSTRSIHQHEHCSILTVSSNGTLLTAAPPVYDHFLVQSIKILPVGKQDAASVHVVMGNSAAGFLVFLYTEGVWKCISAAFSDDDAVKVTPDTLLAVSDLTWNGYGQANRNCNAESMARYFHPQCRLTYVNNGMVEIVDCAAFLAKVAHRYEKEAMHQPYQHLKTDVRSAVGDTLLSIEFATSRVAMVTLKVGHPPCLWTDLLTCAKLGDDGKWWIVHKSSCSEPLLVDEARTIA